MESAVRTYYGSRSFHRMEVASPRLIDGRTVPTRTLDQVGTMGGPMSTEPGLPLWP